MTKLNLDLLKVPVDREDTKIFKDLRLDLKIGSTDKDELYKVGQKLDLQSSDNLGAIKNSFISLLTTSPGEKILNPTFGINFGDLLFLPVTEERAMVIGESILSNISKFEPRIKVINISVIASQIQHKYIIEFAFTIPRFNNQPFSIKGALDSTGFYVTN
tara:strand:- start:141 stop:620 length:480 start_codon:yes stop_codon:yes gene_type:complete